MKVLKQSLKILLDIQILSALIWATVIIGCAYASSDNISTILITGAGFHVVLMTLNAERKTAGKKLTNEVV